MHLTEDKEHLIRLLKETVMMLCKNALNYSHEISVDGIIVITLDDSSTFHVSIKDKSMKLGQPIGSISLKRKSTELHRDGNDKTRETNTKKTKRLTETSARSSDPVPSTLHCPQIVDQDCIEIKEEPVDNGYKEASLVTTTVIDFSKCQVNKGYTGLLEPSHQVLKGNRKGISLDVHVPSIGPNRMVQKTMTTKTAGVTANQEKSTTITPTNKLTPTQVAKEKTSRYSLRDRYPTQPADNTTAVEEPSSKRAQVTPLNSITLEMIDDLAPEVLKNTVKPPTSEVTIRKLSGKIITPEDVGSILQKFDTLQPSNLTVYSGKKAPMKVHSGLSATSSENIATESSWVPTLPTISQGNSTYNLFHCHLCDVKFIMQENYTKHVMEKHNEAKVEPK